MDSGASIETKLPAEPSLVPPHPIAQAKARVNKAKERGVSPDAPEQLKKAKREEKTLAADSSQMATAVKSSAIEKDVPQLKRKKSSGDEVEEGASSKKDAKVVKKSRTRKESSST